VTTQVKDTEELGASRLEADLAQPSGAVTASLTTAPVLLVVLLMALLLRYAALHLSNSDTWFHLTLGERFRTGDWSLRHPGGLTSFATSDWVATQWSTEVIASYFEHWFGLPGVAWLFGALYAAFLLGTYIGSREFGRPLPAAIVSGMVVFGSAPAISARPQIVSLIMLTVVTHAWLRTWRDGRARWWLIPLTWVWATAHGLWSAGILVGAVCWLGILLDRRVEFRRSLILLCVPAGSLLATMLTPVGPRLLTSQLAVSARSSMIAEWGPTSFRSPSALVVAAMIAWLVVLWTRRGSVPWTPLLLLLLAGGWTLLVLRMVPLGAVVVAPLLVQALDSRLPTRASTAAAGRAERWLLGTAAFGYLVVLGVAVPHTADQPADVPQRMLPALRALPPASPVMVDDGIGAWIEWAAPDVDPVIDGMLDAYPVDYIRDFTSFKAIKPGWRDFLAGSHARVAVLREDSAVTGAMQAELHWKVVQKDGDWVYLVAPATP
jgi:hypothetical protein